MSAAFDRRGRLLALVGPDGVGKTTLARHLIDLWQGQTAYVHFRPPILRVPDSRPEPASVPPPPKGKGGSVVVGWVRLIRSLALFWLGYLLRLRPLTRRGCLVVCDRWIYGYVGQPGALGFSGPEWLARSAVRLAPRPDLIVNLEAPVDLILHRKAELTREEVEEELGRWVTLPGRMVTVSAEEPSIEVAEALLASISARR